MSTSYYLVDLQPLKSTIEKIKNLGNALEVRYQESDGKYWIIAHDLKETLRLDVDENQNEVIGFTRFMGNSSKIVHYIAVELQLRMLDEYTRQEYIEKSSGNYFFDKSTSGSIRWCEVDNEEIWDKVKQDNPNYLNCVT